MHVIIVGAGVIGLAIADRIAQNGAAVTVLDMRGPGQGASQASAGLLAPYTEAHPGAPLLRLGERSLALFDDWIAGLHERTSARVEYERTGTIEVALDAGDDARLQEAADWLGTAGIAHEWLSAAALQTFEPAITPGARGGLFIGTHGFVAVPDLVSALSDSAERAGARITTLVEAVEVRSTPEGVEVRTAADVVRGDRAVVATGCWSGRVRIAGLPPVPVRPVRGQLLRLHWTLPPRPSHVVWTSGCYTVPWHDGSVLVGATVEDVGFDERTTDAGIRDLTAAAIAALPGAREARLADVRVGLRPASADGLPYIGPVDDAPHIALATGHYRNGILLAPLTAEIIAAWALEGRRDPTIDWTTPSRIHLSEEGYHHETAR